MEFTLERREGFRMTTRRNQRGQPLEAAATEPVRACTTEMYNTKQQLYG